MEILVEFSLGDVENKTTIKRNIGLIGEFDWKVCNLIGEFDWKVCNLIGEFVGRVCSLIGEFEICLESLKFLVCLLVVIVIIFFPDTTKIPYQIITQNEETFWIYVFCLQKFW